MTLRRIRQNLWTRQITKEVRLSPEQFIQPLFVVEGLSEREAVKGLTGVYRDTPDTLLKQIEQDFEKGIRKFSLFPVPTHKKEQDFDFEFGAQQTRRIKELFHDELWLAVDICLCSSTTHGQCGVVDPTGTKIDNKKSVEELAREATLFAQAGADCVAPSDMMDGRVSAIRSSLDQAEREETLIMSYSAKFHSNYYGPFREAANSAPKGGIALKDRASYQIDPANPSDAVRSSKRDFEEGADILMVKPALAYLDLLSLLSREIPVPWAAYEVSGEWAAVELLAQNGLANGPQLHKENWLSMIRAGASMIISYGARNATDWLSE